MHYHVSDTQFIFQMRTHVQPSTDSQGICQLQETDTLIWWTYYCDAQLSWWLRSASALVNQVVSSRWCETSNFRFLDSRSFGKTQNSSCLFNLCRWLNCQVCADNEPHCLRETLFTEEHAEPLDFQNIPNGLDGLSFRMSPRGCRWTRWHSKRTNVNAQIVGNVLTSQGEGEVVWAINVVGTNGA